MKIFTRIGILVLSLILISGSVFIPPTVAEEANPEAIKAIDLFRTLGVIPDYYDYNIDMSREVTRGDFVHAVYNLVSPGEYKASKTYYYDVPETYWAYDAISYLTEQGVINGSEEKIFEPDAPIEQAAAYKIMLSVLGYGDYASYNGGYPAGYIKVANRLGICEGCSSGPTLTMSDMLILLFQGATCGVYEPESFGKDYNVYSVSEDKTIFSIYKNLHYQIGTVEGANMTSVGNTGLYEEEDVIIDGKVYQSEIDLYDYLGEEVEILYNYQKSTDQKTVTWVYRTDNTNVVTLNVDNNASFQESDFALKYIDEDGKEKAYRLDKNIRMVFNGGETTRSVSDILNLPRYEIKLAGTGNLYTAALVTSPELLIVGSISESEKKIYDKVNPTRSISLNPADYEYLRITLKDGESMEFEDLSAENVLSLYFSENRKRLEIKVGNTTADGVITQVRKKENGTVYVIADVEYYQPDNYNNNEAFSAGDSVTVYLDIRGEVAYIKAGKSNDYAAFLIEGGLSDSAFTQLLKIRLLGQDGIIDAKECQEKIIVDGITYKEHVQAYRALCNENDEFVPQIAMVSYNSDGQISSIDTVNRTAEESEYTLSVNIPYKTGQTYKWFGQIGAMSPVDNNTIFFGVPDDASMATAKDDDFTVVKRSEMVNDSSFSLETYKTVPKSEIEQYVVLKGYSGKNLRNADNPILVTGLGEAMDAEGSTVESLEGFEGTEQVSVPAQAGFSLSALGIGKGDLVRVRKNASGEIVNASIVVDYDELESAVSSTTSFNSAYRLVVGYVNDIVGSVIKIAETEPSVITHVTAVSGIPVLIYNADERTPVTAGEINDADTWYNAGEECSKVVLLTKTASPQLMVIYK